MTSVANIRKRQMEEFLSQFKQHLEELGPDGIQCRVVSKVYPTFIDAINTEVDGGADGKSIFEAVIAIMVHIGVSTVRGYSYPLQRFEHLMKDVGLHGTTRLLESSLTNDNEGTKNADS